jgi:hypothetical protein
LIRDDPGEPGALDSQRSILTTALTLLATCVAPFLVWQTVSGCVEDYLGDNLKQPGTIAGG